MEEPGFAAEQKVPQVDNFGPAYCGATYYKRTSTVSSGTPAVEFTTEAFEAWMQGEIEYDPELGNRKVGSTADGWNRVKKFA